MKCRVILLAVVTECYCLTVLFRHFSETVWLPSISLYSLNIGLLSWSNTVAFSVTYNRAIDDDSLVVCKTEK